MWKSSAFLFFIIIPAFLFEYLLFHLTDNKQNIYNKSHKTAGIRAKVICQNTNPICFLHNL